MTEPCNIYYKNYNFPKSDGLIQHSIIRHLLSDSWLHIHQSKAEYVPGFLTNQQQVIVTILLLKEYFTADERTIKDFSLLKDIMALFIFSFIFGNCNF